MRNMARILSYSLSLTFSHFLKSFIAFFSSVFPFSSCERATYQQARGQIHYCGTGRVRRHSVSVTGALLLNQAFVFAPVMPFEIFGNLNSRSLVTGRSEEGKKSLECDLGTCSKASRASDTSGGTFWNFLLTPIQFDSLKVVSALTTVVCCMLEDMRGNR